jgi:hypothetical protein
MSELRDNGMAATPFLQTGCSLALSEGTLQMTKLQPRCLRPLLIISVLAIATTVVPASPPAQTLTGKVVSIADGDTLTLLVEKTQIRGCQWGGIDRIRRLMSQSRSMILSFRFAVS